jgi:hypothetical protein
MSSAIVSTWPAEGVSSRSSLTRLVSDPQLHALSESSAVAINDLKDDDAKER